MSTADPNNPPKVKVIKEFNSSPEKVFDAWLDPELIGQWMFGPELRDEKIVSLDTDPHVGGTFSFVVSRDGTELDHTGTYREIDRPHRLVFTWWIDEEAGDESVVTINIEPTSDGCRLTLVHEMAPKWKDYTERTQKGWTEMLNKLGELL